VVTVTVGEAVSFVNTGSGPHTATADAGSGTWDSGNLEPDNSYSTPVFTAPGTYHQHCIYHEALCATGLNVGSASIQRFDLGFPARGCMDLSGPPGPSP
jgi:plastocyanin